MSPLLSMVIASALYLAAGAFREVLVVTYYRLIAKNKRYSVSGLAGGIEAYDLLVLALVIQSGWSPLLMGSYVLGVMVGTFLGMSKK
jgi:hypothetical protein